MATTRAPGRAAAVAIGLTVAGVVARVALSIPAVVVPLDPLAGFVAATVVGTTALVIVPIPVHGCYDALVFAVAYLALGLLKLPTIAALG